MCRNIETYYAETLKCITISFFNEDFLYAQLICVTRLVNIERIIIEFPIGKLEHHISVELATKIAQMNKLNFFSWHGGFPSLIPFIDTLSASQSIEELDLENLGGKDECLEPNLMEKFDKFPNLKTCKLKYRWFARVDNEREEKWYRSLHYKRKVKNFNVVETDSSSQWNNCVQYFDKSVSVTLLRKN